MRAILHVLAIILLVGAIAWWWHAGLNKGWTKNSVQVWNFDEVTEISYPQAVDRFVPGVDFLAAAGVGSLLLWGAGFFAKKRNKSIN